MQKASQGAEEVGAQAEVQQQQPPRPQPEEEAGDAEDLASLNEPLRLTQVGGG